MCLLCVACDGLQQQGEDYILDKYKDVTKNVKLNDEVIQKYCATYRQLREAGPAFLQMSEGGAEGKDGFNKFEGVVKGGGFKDYADFVATNARIAWAWNMSQGQVGLAAFDEQYKQGVATMLYYINSPETPQVTKDSLKAGLQRIQETYAHNRKWADYVMNKLEPLTSKEDVELVKRHYKCLIESYTGYSMEQLGQ